MILKDHRTEPPAGRGDDVFVTEERPLTPADQERMRTLKASIAELTPAQRDELQMLYLRRWLARGHARVAS